MLRAQAARHRGSGGDFVPFRRILQKQQEGANQEQQQPQRRNERRRNGFLRGNQEVLRLRRTINHVPVRVIHTLSSNLQHTYNNIL